MQNHEIQAGAGTRTRDRWVPPEPINLYIKKWYIQVWSGEKKLATEESGTFCQKRVQNVNKCFT